MQHAVGGRAAAGVRPAGAQRAAQPSCPRALVPSKPVRRRAALAPTRASGANVVGAVVAGAPEHRPGWTWSAPPVRGLLCLVLASSGSPGRGHAARRRRRAPLGARPSRATRASCASRARVRGAACTRRAALPPFVRALSARNPLHATTARARNVAHDAQEFKQQANVKSREEYDVMYKRSIDDPVGFWSDIAKQFHW
jgi:hypothetical protein